MSKGKGKISKKALKSIASMAEDEEKDNEDSNSDTDHCNPWPAEPEAAHDFPPLGVPQLNAGKPLRASFSQQVAAAVKIQAGTRGWQYRHRHYRLPDPVSLAP